MTDFTSPPSPELSGEDLRALAPYAQALGKAKLQAQAKTLAGDRLSKRKGHGLELYEIRPYHANDEVRHIDWRVTARTGAPHARVYTEEREPKTLVILALSRDAYFGTQTTFISTRFSQLAALIGWRCQAKREQLELNIPFRFNAPQVKDWHRFSLELADCTMLDRIEEAAPLLELEANTGTRGCSVVILSDHLNLSDQSRQVLTHMARHNRVYWVSLEDDQTFKLPSGAYTLKTPQGPKALRVNAQEMARLGERYAIKQQQFNGELSAIGVRRLLFDVNHSPIAIARELLHLGVIH